MEMLSGIIIGFILVAIAVVVCKVAMDFLDNYVDEKMSRLNDNVRDNSSRILSMQSSVVDLKERVRAIERRGFVSPDEDVS